MSYTCCTWHRLPTAFASSDPCRQITSFAWTTIPSFAISLTAFEIAHRSSASARQVPLSFWPFPEFSFTLSSAPTAAFALCFVAASRRFQLYAELQSQLTPCKIAYRFFKRLTSLMEEGWPASDSLLSSSIDLKII